MALSKNPQLTPWGSVAGLKMEPTNFDPFAKTKKGHRRVALRATVDSLRKGTLTPKKADAVEAMLYAALSF